MKHKKQAILNNNGFHDPLFLVKLNENKLAIALMDSQNSCFSVTAFGSTKSKK